MPRNNRMGPEGKGPMSGRGMGDCNTANSETGYGDGFGRGRGAGRNGGGRGAGRNQMFTRGNRFADFDNNSETVQLRNEIDNLKNQLQSIEQKISDKE